MNLPTLYKRNVTGTIQQWWIEVDGDKYRTCEGIVKLNDGSEGAVTVSKWTVCQGKNAGRSNATTDAEQALSEARSKWTKKCNHGYFENIDMIDNDRGFFEPMLAVKYAAHSHRFLGAGDNLSVKVVHQPKLDGVRCIIRSDGMWTREGKPIVSCPHVFNALRPIIDAHPNLIFDGELYNHELKSDFQKIVSLVRKTKPTVEDLIESERLVQYHDYDICDLNQPKLGFEERFDIISRKLWTEFDFPKYLKIVETEVVATASRLDELYAQVMEQGYEGQIVRLLGKQYENKRTPNLIKRKEFDDGEFEIVGVLEGTGNRSGMAGKLDMITSSGIQFRAGIKGGEAWYARLLHDQDKLRGKKATIRHQGFTNDGKPRFPVVYAIRDYE